MPERKGADPEAVRQEVETALVAGAAIPDGMEGALRLRTHRFIRGGWQFHRCVDPACGKLYPMGEERCSACGKATAPVYLCRSCGVDTLRFRGGEDPTAAPLEPNDSRTNEGEWVLYHQERRAEEEEDLIEIDTDRQLRRRLVLPGSFDPAVGGSGFLERAAEELHLVARRTLDHLDHPGCESACYRCLKSYNNQRHHQYLSWPEVIPDLEQLGELAPQPIQSELGDAEDPRPWLDCRQGMNSSSSSTLTLRARSARRVSGHFSTGRVMRARTRVFSVGRFFVSTDIDRLATRCGVLSP
ncbi:MAG: DUF1998 domain-containing protein [Candidatus Latescibacteria bacterium]|nr:DUF1998 domain-containing protein [Candidatus Latescibacterota bacterium]